MDVLVYAIVVLVVAALVFVATKYILGVVGVPAIFMSIILALVLILAAVMIARKAGII